MTIMVFKDGEWKENRDFKVHAGGGIKTAKSVNVFKDGEWHDVWPPRPPKIIRILGNVGSIVLESYFQSHAIYRGDNVKIIVGYEDGSDAYIGGDDINTYAIDTGDLRIYGNVELMVLSGAYIMGMGGKGGKGGGYDVESATEGGRGGPAICVRSTSAGKFSIDNRGFLFGGGKGGKGGERNFEHYGTLKIQGGGGGGGGAGYGVGGLGGTRSPQYGSSGSKGGTGSLYGGGSGGKGGQYDLNTGGKAGKPGEKGGAYGDGIAITGNTYIKWINKGTIKGAVI